jgi:hypothetical protein
VSKRRHVDQAPPPRPGGRAWSIEDTVAATDAARAAAEDLRQARREANEATADLRQAIRSLRETLPTIARDAVEELLKRHANAEMDRMSGEVEAAIDRVAAELRAKLHQLLETYLAGERGEPSLPELVAARQALRKSQEAAEADRRRARTSSS